MKSCVQNSNSKIKFNVIYRKDFNVKTGSRRENTLSPMRCNTVLRSMITVVLGTDVRIRLENKKD